MLESTQIKAWVVTFVWHSRWVMSSLSHATKGQLKMKIDYFNLLNLCLLSVWMGHESWTSKKVHSIYRLNEINSSKNTRPILLKKLLFLLKRNPSIRQIAFRERPNKFAQVWFIHYSSSTYLAAVTIEWLWLLSVKAISWMGLPRLLPKQKGNRTRATGLWVGHSLHKATSKSTSMKPF